MTGHKAPVLRTTDLVQSPAPQVLLNITCSLKTPDHYTVSPNSPLITGPEYHALLRLHIELMVQLAKSQKQGVGVCVPRHSKHFLGTTPTPQKIIFLVLLGQPQQADNTYLYYLVTYKDGKWLSSLPKRKNPSLYFFRLYS